MENELHPAIVHFPIALFVSALGFEIVGIILKKENFHRTSMYLYILATLIAPLAVWTGWTEVQEHNFRHPVLDIHSTFAFFVMWFSFMSLPVLWAIGRRSVKSFRLIFFACLLVIVGSVAITAYNGGRMVYEYGIGIKH